MWLTVNWRALRLEESYYSDIFDTIILVTYPRPIR